MERAAVCVLLSKPLSVSFYVSEAAVLQCGVSKKYQKEGIYKNYEEKAFTHYNSSFVFYSLLCKGFVTGLL